MTGVYDRGVTRLMVETNNAGEKLEMPNLSLWSTKLSVSVLGSSGKTELEATA